MATATLTSTDVVVLSPRYVTIQVRVMQDGEIEAVMQRALLLLREPWIEGTYTVVRLNSDIRWCHMKEWFRFLAMVDRTIDSLKQLGEIQAAETLQLYDVLPRNHQFYLLIQRHRVCGERVE